MNIQQSGAAENGLAAVVVGADPCGQSFYNSQQRRPLIDRCEHVLALGYRFRHRLTLFEHALNVQVDGLLSLGVQSRFFKSMIRELQRPAILGNCPHRFRCLSPRRYAE